MTTRSILFAYFSNIDLRELVFISTYLVEFGFPLKIIVL